MSTFRENRNRWSWVSTLKSALERALRAHAAPLSLLSASAYVALSALLTRSGCERHAPLPAIPSRRDPPRLCVAHNLSWQLSDVCTCGTADRLSRYKTFGARRGGLAAAMTSMVAASRATTCTSAPRGGSAAAKRSARAVPRAVLERMAGEPSEKAAAGSVPRYAKPRETPDYRALAAARMERLGTETAFEVRSRGRGPSSSHRSPRLLLLACVALPCYRTRPSLEALAAQRIFKGSELKLHCTVHNSIRCETLSEAQGSGLAGMVSKTKATWQLSKTEAGKVATTSVNRMASAEGGLPRARI